MKISVSEEDVLNDTGSEGPDPLNLQEYPPVTLLYWKDPESPAPLMLYVAVDADRVDGVDAIRARRQKELILREIFKKFQDCTARLFEPPPPRNM
jgi:hypothetical protein